MSVTFRATATGRTATLPERDDPPRGHMAWARRKAIARLDASPGWERVDAKTSKKKADEDQAGDRSSTQSDA